MATAKSIVLVGALLVAGYFPVHYLLDFSRLKRVEAGNTPFQPGSLNKVVFKNGASSPVKFLLRCHFKVRAEGPPLFTRTVQVPANSSVEFDINPELDGFELPRMVANKACEAVWQGPFGWERSAWWVVGIRPAGAHGPVLSGSATQHLGGQPGLKFSSACAGANEEGARVLWLNRHRAPPFPDGRTD